MAFVNPFDEANQQFEDFIRQRQEEREAEERFKKDNNALGFSRPAAAPKCVCVSGWWGVDGWAGAWVGSHFRVYITHTTQRH